VNIISNDGHYYAHLSLLKNRKNEDNHKVVTSYGVSTDNANLNKQLNLQGHIIRATTEREENTENRKELSASASLEGLRLSTQKDTENNNGANINNSTVANIDFQKMGDVDLTHTLTHSDDKKNVTSETQSASYKDKEITLSAGREKTGNDGTTQNKNIKAVYDTQSQDVSLNLGNSSKSNDSSVNNDLQLKSATDRLNMTGTYTRTLDKTDGKSNTLSAVTNYGEETSATVNHTVVKKEEGTTTTNVQNAGYQNDTVSASLTSKHESENGTTTKNADAKYDIEGKRIELGLDKKYTGDNGGNGTRHIGLAFGSDNLKKVKADFKTTNTDENGATRELFASASATGSAEFHYSTENSRTETDADGNETEHGSSHEGGVTFDREGKTLDFNYSQHKTINGEEQSEFTVTGNLNKDGGETSVTTSKINKHGRRVATKVSANASKEAQHLGLRFERNVHNTSSTPVEEGKKPKKNKSFFFAADITKTETESLDDSGYDDYDSDYDSEESYSDELDLLDSSEQSSSLDDLNEDENLTGSDAAGTDESMLTESLPEEDTVAEKEGQDTTDSSTDETSGDISSDEILETENEPEENIEDTSSENNSETDYNEDDETGDDDYEESGYGNYDDTNYDYSEGTSKQKTDFDIKTGVKIGNDAFVLGTKNFSDSVNAGYTHKYHSKKRNTFGTVSAFADYTKENGVNLGTGASKIKLNENGGLKNAMAGSVTYNPKNGNVTATGGIAAPLHDKNGNNIGNMSTYAQFNSKGTSITAGGQISRVFYKKSDDTADNEGEESTLDLESGYRTDGNTDSITENDFESVGQQELANEDDVNSELNNAGEASGNRKVAGGIFVKGEIGHAKDRNPALEYNVDVQGFVNTKIAGKDATLYGRVTSTNGQLDEVNNTYGREINNPLDGDIQAAASDNSNMDKYRSAALRDNEAEVNNTTSIGLGAVAGNPDQTGSNFAGAANAVFEDGKLTQYTGMGRGEYVFETGDSRQAFGAEAMYTTDKNSQSNKFSADAYYDHTFNSGKTRINTGFGYMSENMQGYGSKTLFTSIGARQQVAKNVDLYGQFEFGQTTGFGSMENSKTTYSAARLGAQYHMNKKTVVFAEYNTGHGSAMSSSRMIPQAQKDKMKAGNFMIGIGMRF